MATCSKCGGTGERFDSEIDDWFSPMEPCLKCKGSGEASVCETGEHVPNYSGFCTICGYEVLTEVDDNGDPIPNVE